MARGAASHELSQLELCGLRYAAKMESALTQGQHRSLSCKISTSLLRAARNGKMAWCDGDPNLTVQLTLPPCVRTFPQCPKPKHSVEQT